MLALAEYSLTGGVAQLVHWGRLICLGGHPGIQGMMMTLKWGSYGTRDYWLVVHVGALEVEHG